MTFTTLGAGHPEVETNPVTDVTDNSATLHGELTDMGEESEVDVFLRYREVGQTSWQETSYESVSSTGDFDNTVSGLSPDTSYEFKAVVSWNPEYTGGIETFATQDDEDDDDDDDTGFDDDDDDTGFVDPGDPDETVDDPEGIDTATMVIIAIIAIILIGGGAVYVNENEELLDRGGGGSRRK